MKWSNWLPTLLLVAVVAGAVVWNNRQDSDSGSARLEPDRVGDCMDLAGEPVDRLHACYDAVRRSELSDEAAASLTSIAKGGALFSVGAKLDIDEDVLVVQDLPDVEAVLLGTDEEAVSKLLREKKIRGVIVHRDIVGALDRDNVVLARLAHHDFLLWFQLRYVTQDLMIYTVRSSPAWLPVDTGEALLSGLRARLDGTPPAEYPPQRWNPGTLRLIGSMRLQGKTLAWRHTITASRPGNAVPVAGAALDELASKLKREWERTVEPDGHGRLEDRLDDVRLEIHVVMERAPVEPRSRYAIFDLWEMGVDGMMFRQRAPEPGEKLDEKFTYLPGSELLALSHKSADAFLKYAVERFGWNDSRPWEKDKRTRLDLIRDNHFMESTPGGGPAIRLVRGMPEVPMEWVTDKNVQDMLVAGGEWWLYNLRDDDSFEYKYWPVQNRRSDDYNEVRHILAARDLADTWRFRNDQRYLDGSRRAMDWLLKYGVDAAAKPEGPLPHPPANTMLFRYPSYAEQSRIKKQANQKLGTVAVALLGWVAWADSSGSHAEDERIRKMAEFTRALQEPDGRFRAYFVHPGHSYENNKNDIVPGEAMLALGMVSEYFDEPEWLEAYPKFIEYYQPWFRKRAERKRPTGRWPHHTYTDLDRLDLVQFGPWSVMAAKQVYRLNGDEEAAEFGLEVADWMIDNYQWQGARSPWPDYIGGYYKLPEELPAMQTFCYSEGTAAAYLLASRYAPERKGKYELATAEAIRFLEVMQYDDTDAYFTPRPDKNRGGIKYTMNENKVRIDYVGHGLSTLSQWLDAREYDPAVELDIHDPTDLDRLAGSVNSVPGLDYSNERPKLPSAEWPRFADRALAPPEDNDPSPDGGGEEVPL